MALFFDYGDRMIFIDTIGNADPIDASRKLLHGNQTIGLCQNT